MTDFRPLVITARPDAAILARFEALRRAHFPPALNRVPAHISLFHQIPGSEFDAVVERLKAMAREHPAPQVEITGLRSLGRGVAYVLRSAELSALHDDLSEAWEPLLIPQDRHRLAAHVTIQNKVTPEVARATLAALSEGFEPWRFDVVGIDVWRYLDGPWEHLKTVGLRPA
ncbi:2'-5' RNA ligase family protein [Polymorphobacter sp. PAMC 29334]|uniref:2'-5' RNA ligase family protein n=1 Tax=Polymorphobacter sp. PAMC 29334 TaxID=2862331 RepID=UPI001C666623|nr:2'-5' RNA ligase family protein [Polymorphobacter sp. PAMC 29334]QYE34510.1 2'-5' RNA ligase family protein [Polymorphobacter sp. PAMC 29334]